MIQNKRIFLYDLKLETFYDSNDSGYGDFNGLKQKIDYLTFLDVNCVAIEDILKHYENKFELEKVNFNYGSIEDFKELKKALDLKNIDLAITLNLTKIKQSATNLNNYENLYRKANLEKTQELTILDTYIKNENKYLNLNTIASFVEEFKKVINFYNNLNIQTLILEDFDFLIEDKKLNKQNRFQFLVDIFKIVKK
ncbi:alpha-amylase family glycosyl hydrolase [Mycoplasma struthionis]|uniref:Glycosyl hydrolase family 13 catalytic domain-containing protein n=1 Tax=Mycoplasma struthionis TaxID=538220 RepID=A0A3G8LHK3_9MOLU|nr:alpha-amylase family glycosyl hydrolase [Mycoplasma struthionis]AZG68834.1 hypothetical protein EGN60_02635 [Mycoplasma struthionis]